MRINQSCLNIHPQLQHDCLVIGRFPLCYLLLMKDSNYPWFILVPDREHITEIHQLDETEQKQLISESSVLSRIIDKQFNADKINIAALGNLVPQLHVHHIVRYKNDAAWPAPVWGKLPAKAYTEEETNQVINRLKSSLSENFEYLL
jgi:diadenosine tetraphosphate (Ap4A) HIT family hydrolase